MCSMSYHVLSFSPCCSGRLLRALNVEFNWLKLAAWVNLTEQWPYRISWMILEVEDNSEDLEESTSLKLLYDRSVRL